MELPKTIPGLPGSNQSLEINLRALEQEEAVSCKQIKCQLLPKLTI
jgi:hypothetical protein